ncbi:MAG: hypothetical protein JAZ03_21075 [Candidatus Thiodiazotropha taylori]|nr:hypothetical protein [Candidatus Thiodiazotropha taylori]MCW4336420.1 hypothetical protein [Candidatus Thiodiazotropha endolucinida]
MNIYTASVNDLATVKGIGKGSANKIVDMRDKVLIGQQEPLTVEDLSSIRLSPQEWQTLVDDGTISLQLPEPGRGNGQRPQFVTHAEMQTCMENILSKYSKELKSYMQEVRSQFTSEISDVKGDLSSRMDGFEEKLEVVTTKERQLASDLTKQIEDTRSELMSVKQKVVPHDYSSGLTGRFPEMPMPSMGSDMFDLKPKLDSEVKGFDRGQNADEAIMSRLAAAIPSDGIYGKVTLPKGSKNKQQRERGRSPEKKPRGKTHHSPPHISSDSDSSDGDSDRSLSPLPPKMEVFSGDLKGPTWSSFITKFDRISRRRGWTKRKRLARLFDCLSETALEFANRCEGQTSYRKLKKELSLRFDLKDAPVAARQRLHLMKQSEDEGLEVYLQRVLTTAMDGFSTADNNTIQHLATESFLRGCRDKEAAALVINEGPHTIQEACQKLKTVVANRKAIFGTKVSFQERVFTVEEEKRVSEIEHKLDHLAECFRRSSPSPYRSPSPFRPRYSPSPYRGDHWDRGRINSRRRSPSYGGWSSRDPEMQRYGGRENRGRSPTSRSRIPIPNPQRSRQYDRYPPYSDQSRYYNRADSPNNQYSQLPYQPRYNNRADSPNYRRNYAPSPVRPPNRPDYFQQGKSPQEPSSLDPNKYRQRLAYPAETETYKLEHSLSSGLPEKNQDLNLEGLTTPATGC